MRHTESGKYIVMLGNDLSALGGMSAVVNSYFAGGLGRQWPIRYLASFHHKKTLNKLWMALRALIVLLAWLASGRVAAVHAHSAARGSFWRKRMYLGLARLFGCRTFLHIHDGSFAAWYQNDLSATRKEDVRRALRSADQVIVLSQGWARELRAIEPAAALRVLQNPVPIPAAAALRPVSAAATQRVLFLARLWPQKGVYELLDAFAELAPRWPDAVLVCAGDGELAAVQARADALGIGSRVQLLGWIDGETKHRELLRSDLFVLPSYHEGVPIGILEAMAWAVPVVATDVGGISEALGDGGLLCQPRDVASLVQAMDRLLGDVELARSLGQAGRRRAQQRHALPVVLEDLGSLYRASGLAALEKKDQQVADQSRLRDHL